VLHRIKGSTDSSEDYEIAAACGKNRFAVAGADPDSSDL
jgi:hypothetical protein